MDLRQVNTYIDSHSQQAVEELRRLMRQPSVSSEDRGVQECAELLAGMMRDVGIETMIVPAKCHPMVFGERKSKASTKTLLVTGHYDVVPPGPREAWVCDPFAAELLDGVITGRGAVDPKGNVVAVLNAVQALLQTTGNLPLNLKFLFDGDDESDKGDLGQFVKEHRDLLQADAVLLVDAGFDPLGKCPIHLGNAGALSLQLQVRTGTRDAVMIKAQLVPNAAWRLTSALASLKDSDDRITLDGFHDDIVPPTQKELELLRNYPWDDEHELRRYGLREFLGHVKGIDAVKRLLSEPSLSICGFHSGYTGEGVEGIVPCEAKAWIHFHLVPDQRPQDILEKLNAHFQKHGFGDIQVNKLSELEPVAGSPDSLLGNAVMQAAGQVGVHAYLVGRTFDLGERGSWLGKQLGVDAAQVGIGDPDRNAHFPNEHISVNYYVNGIKWLAAIFDAYAQVQ